MNYQVKIDTIKDLYTYTRNQLEGKSGNVNISFANRTHVYTGNDVIGNCLQEWLPNWFTFLGVKIRSGPNSQSFPDFIAEFSGLSYDIEVKAWNINNSPAFDIANFQSFVETTYDDPGKINAHYFILGYDPYDDGFSQGFVVKKVYLKQLWEIMSPSRKYPINLQVKREQPYAIRPYNFHRYPERAFKSRSELIEAVAQTIKLFPNPQNSFSARDWYNKLNNN